MQYRKRVSWRKAFGAGLLLATAAVPSFQSVTAQTAPAPQGLEVIAMEAGVWDAEITFPSNDPAKPDTKVKGVQTNRLRSGGLWIINEFSVDGTPYEGTGVWGFDRMTGRFRGIWVDNNDQQIRTDDGRWDAATRTMTWKADVLQPNGIWQRLLITNKFEAQVRRFDVVALTRKGAVPLVQMVLTKRPDPAAR